MPHDFSTEADCKFALGEIVAMPRFTDCFGKVYPRIENLVVIARRLIEAGERIPPYWRIKVACDPEGLDWYEATESWFEKYPPIEHAE